MIGVGGVWAWAELDNVSTVTGWNEMDATFAACDHTTGGGPGTAGAHGGPDPVGVWQQYTSLGDALNANPHAVSSAIGAAYRGSVYVLDFFPGSGPGEDFKVIVPTRQGHYSAHPVPGGWLCEKGHGRHQRASTCHGIDDRVAGVSLGGARPAFTVS